MNLNPDAISRRQDAGRRSSLRRTCVSVLHVLLVGLLGGWLAVILAGGVKLSLGPITAYGEVRPALHGQTTVELPPAGAISARTHSMPIELRARVDEVHVGPLMAWAKNGITRQELPEWLRPRLTRLATALAVRSLVAAALGAAIVGFLCGLRRRRWLAGVLTGVLGVALPLALTALTFHPQAFVDARYTGELARAPELIRLAGGDLRQFTSTAGGFTLAADRAERIYQRFSTLGSAAPAPTERMTRVLQISDLHNNPLGLRFAVDLARAYRVDLVLVTGDVSDLGHPLESGLLATWEQFRVPVVMVTGNHDSRAIAQNLGHLRGITILNGNRVTRAGLTIGGYGDPQAARDGVGSAKVDTRGLAKLQRRILRDLDQATPPDILLVHNHDVARHLLGHAPVILCGHSHTAMMRRDGDSVMVNAGTTGAAGVRYFTEESQPAYGAAILNFTRERTPALRYVDFIKVDQAQGNFAVQRRDLQRWTDGNTFYMP